MIRLRAGKSEYFLCFQTGEASYNAAKVRSEGMLFRLDTGNHRQEGDFILKKVVLNRHY